MLSRQLLRAANVARPAIAFDSASVLRATPSMTTVARGLYQEGPERDLVNFPRPVRPENSLPCRFLFIPESWFDFFYKKTGVTGPYVLGGGYISYLLSKEIWVIDHDFPYVITFFLWCAIAKYKFGDKIEAFLVNQQKAKEAGLLNSHKEIIDGLKNNIAHLEKEISRGDAQKEIFKAKRENILMQLEAEYRSRALDVYNQVKKRLDYQLQIESIDRRIAHKNMVTWIIDNVKKNITPQQEKESLKKCFADLQALAAKA